MSYEGIGMESLVEAVDIEDDDLFVVQTPEPVTKKSKWITISNKMKEKINHFIFDDLNTEEKLFQER